VSVAKKAVDNTLRRILNYTAEIIIAIILLVVICIPLVFAIPIWFQYILFGIPKAELSVNPILWFGLDGTILITLFLGLVSSGISYVYVLKMKPGVISEKKVEEIESESFKERSEDTTFETSLEDEEDIPLEDQEIEDFDDEAVSPEDQEEADIDEI